MTKPFHHLVRKDFSFWWQFHWHCGGKSKLWFLIFISYFFLSILNQLEKAGDAVSDSQLRPKKSKRVLLVSVADNLLQIKKIQNKDAMVCKSLSLTEQINFGPTPIAGEVCGSELSWVELSRGQRLCPAGPPSPSHALPASIYGAAPSPPVEGALSQ